MEKPAAGPQEDPGPQAMAFWSPFQDYKKVPIAVFSDGTVVGDSTKIVDKVAGSEAALGMGCLCFLDALLEYRNSVLRFI